MQYVVIITDQHNEILHHIAVAFSALDIGYKIKRFHPLYSAEYLRFNSVSKLVVYFAHKSSISLRIST